MTKKENFYIMKTIIFIGKSDYRMIIKFFILINLDSKSINSITNL